MQDIMKTYLIFFWEVDMTKNKMGNFNTHLIRNPVVFKL